MFEKVIHYILDHPILRPFSVILIFSGSAFLSLWFYKKIFYTLPQFFFHLSGKEILEFWIYVILLWVIIIALKTIFCPRGVNR